MYRHRERPAHIITQVLKSNSHHIETPWYQLGISHSVKTNSLQTQLSRRPRKPLDESSTPLARPAHEGETECDKEQNEKNPNEGSVCLGHSTPTGDIILCLLCIIVVVLRLANFDDLPKRSQDVIGVSTAASLDLSYECLVRFPLDVWPWLF